MRLDSAKRLGLILFAGIGAIFVLTAVTISLTISKTECLGPSIFLDKTIQNTAEYLRRKREKAFCGGPTLASLFGTNGARSLAQ